MRPTQSCACTSACGDDPNVQARLVLGCADYRARANPALMVERLRADLAAVEKERDELRKQASDDKQLRTHLAGLVDLMDRMEPDSPNDVREQAEIEWDERKAAAKLLLAGME